MGMHWKRRVVLTCVLIAVASSVVPASGQVFAHLRPGKIASLRERVPVNVVFVGISAKRIEQPYFKASLPLAYRPVLRIASLLKHKPQPLGLSYTFDYRFHFASKAYDDAFFGYLKKSAADTPLTHWQERYNAQAGRVDIDKNHAIDAASVERWLATHPPKGIDTRRNTVFLIDWYGRKDFRHHVYTKAIEPDSSWGAPGAYSEPDRDVFVAWGGTAADDPEDGNGITRRLWFYDLSAGPDYWSGNWDVTTMDPGPLNRPLDTSRRIPPSWEYAADGIRAPDRLTDDLAALTRYVAIDLLFTPSPLYPAITTPNGRPASIELDMNFYDTPGFESAAKGSAPVMLRTFRNLAPWLRFSADTKPVDFTNADHLSCFAQWSTVYLASGPSCYQDARYTAEANLVLFHSRNRKQFFDGGGDYEGGSFVYHVPGQAGPCYAYADDDRLTGAQSFVFAFLGAPCEPDMGWSDLLIHEYGHHVGLSHPHDGYDSEEEKDFGPADNFAFVYAGTEVNSAMAYHSVNNEFSQFDADNMARWAAEGYVSSANMLAARLLAAGVSARTLAKADDLVGAAAKALSAHRYRDAADAARRAYHSLIPPARRARVGLAARPAGAPANAGPVPSGRGGMALAPAVDRLCEAATFCR